MKITFVKNNYLIIWNLLYGPSFSVKTQAFKQKLWITYKKEYRAMEHDKDEILKDIKNFIPDDNTLYDLLEDTKVFNQLEKETERHRLELMKAWDCYKKKIEEELKRILKITLDNYQIVVLHPAMNTFFSGENSPTIAWGKKKDLEDKLYTILQFILEFLKMKIDYEEEQDKNIATAVLELALFNECYMSVETENTTFRIMENKILKEAIYPYFLMYLGIDLDDAPTYMMRDKIAFDVEDYTNEVQLRTFDIWKFIEFIIRNKRKILKTEEVFAEVA